MNLRLKLKAVIVKEGKYLLLLRSETENEPLTWDFPGGGKDDNEDDIACLLREAKEETGLDIDIGKLIGDYPMQINGIDYLFRAYHATILPGNNAIKISHEHKEYRWASLEEVKLLELSSFLKIFFG